MLPFDFLMYQMPVIRLAALLSANHGSLYSQFGSKERLIEEAVGHAITTQQQETPEVFSATACRHRCVLPAAPSSRISRLSFDVGFACDPYAEAKTHLHFQHSCRDPEYLGCRWPINLPTGNPHDFYRQRSEFTPRAGTRPRAPTARGRCGAATRQGDPDHEPSMQVFDLLEKAGGWNRIAPCRTSVSSSLSDVPMGRRSGSKQMSGDG